MRRAGRRPGGRATALATLAALGTGLALGAGGCAVPPWSMGAPLDGKPSIPATTEALSIPSLRARARTERAAGHIALELRALRDIARAERLRADERERLAVLLEQRARELLALGRAVPACADLRELEELAPARARALAATHAAAERDAGDVWLAVGDHLRARDAYERAAALGASATDFRLAAAAETLPAHVALAVAQRAVLELPLRAVPPFAELYLDAARDGAASGGGEAARDGGQAIRLAALERAARAARQEKQPALAARIAALLAAAGGGADGDGGGGGDGQGGAHADADADADGGADRGGGGGARSDQPGAERLADTLLDTPAAPPAARPPADPAALDDWVLGAPSVSSRLLPLLERAARPVATGALPAGAAAGLLAPGPRSRAWAELLLEEDPTSPDVLELTAIIDALAGRIGGAERKLTDLVYFTPDRYQGLARAAGIWQRVGQGRLGCVAWLRAARWRDEIDDPAWGRALACMRRNPGTGDWRSVLAYVLDRTPAERRAAAAATLDPTEAPLEAPAVPPVNARPAGAPIPCDTGGSPR